MPSDAKHKRFDSEDDEDEVLYQAPLTSANVHDEQGSDSSDDDAPPEAISLGKGKDDALSKSRLLVEHDKGCATISTITL